MIYTQKPLSLISRLIHSSDHCMHRASNLYLINSISTLYRKPTDRLDSGSFCIKAKIYISMMVANKSLNRQRMTSEKPYVLVPLVGTVR